MVDTYDIVFSILVLIAFSGAIFEIYISFQEYQDYKVYKDYCNNKPEVCYCSWGECTFRSVTWTKNLNGVQIEVGMDNQTKELCDLATKLNDKEMLFKTGCYNE